METTPQTKIESIKNWLGSGSLNIFGLPFAGKDTHGRELADTLDGVLLGGGEILRESKAYSHLNEHISSGALAPTEEYMRIMLPYLSQEKFQNKPLILSAVGRWHGEEAGVLEATAAANHPLKAVIYLHITEDELRKRWQNSQEKQDRGNRKDDAKEVLEKRISEFTEKTLPVIDFYRESGLLIEVNGLRPKDQVSNRIIDLLYERSLT